MGKKVMIHLTEPVRKSALDVIQHNLHAAGCNTYVTRVVYFGEYHGTHEVLQKRMQNIIHNLHMDYSDMPITGLFLVYPTCYIHVLEAWEDIIYKHYELMYSAGDNKFGKAIPLPSYHHVHQRFFTSWYHVYTTPPTLIGTIEDYTLDDIQKQALNCLMKIYTLCNYLATTGLDKKSIDIQDTLRNLGDKATRYLPESTVLEFLLSVNSPVLKTVEEYLQIYSDVSPSAFWNVTIAFFMKIGAREGIIIHRRIIMYGHHLAISCHATCSTNMVVDRSYISQTVKNKRALEVRKSLTRCKKKR